MGCWHGHGSWCGGPPPRGWYGPPTGEPDWLEQEEWPVRRRHRGRGRPIDPELATASLETRLGELREELERVEAALGELRPVGEAPE